MKAREEEAKWRAEENARIQEENERKNQEWRDRHAEMDEQAILDALAVNHETENRREKILHNGGADAKVVDEFIWGVEDDFMHTQKYIENEARDISNELARPSGWKDATWTER